MADGDWEDEAGGDWEDVAPKAKASAAKSGVGGAFQGATLNFGDELGGALTRLVLGKGVKLGKGAQPASDDSPTLRALKGQVLAEQDAAPSTYEIGRDLVRKDLNEAREANPGTFLAGEIAGGSLLPIPGGVAAQGATKGAKILRAAAQGAGTGAVYGLGASDAQLSRGDVGGTLGDMAIGAGLGGVGGAVAEGVVAPVVEKGAQLAGKAATALRQRASKGFADAEQGLRDLAEAAVRKKAKSAAGTLGTETQQGNRFVENLMRLEASGTPAQKQAIQAMRQSGVVGDLQERLLDSTIDSIPGQKQVIDAARSELDDITANKAQHFADALKQADDPMAQIKPRLQRYAAPLASALVGAPIGGAVGLAAGGDAGDVAISALAGAGMRPAAHALRRMVQHPSIAKRGYGLASKLLGPGGQPAAAPGRVLQSLATAPSRSGAVFDGGEAFADGSARSIEALVRALMGRQKDDDVASR